jgi:hypothetical protein
VSADNLAARGFGKERLDVGDFPLERRDLDLAHVFDLPLHALAAGLFIPGH